MAIFDCLTLGKINVHDIGKPNLGIWGYGSAVVTREGFKSCDQGVGDRCGITGLECPLMRINKVQAGSLFHPNAGYSKFENPSSMAFVSKVI